MGASNSRAMPDDTTIIYLVKGCNCNCGCGSPDCNCPESKINDYCCKVGDGTSVCCNIADRKPKSGNQLGVYYQ